jgi:hypothetical protein
MRLRPGDRSTTENLLIIGGMKTIGTSLTSGVTGTACARSRAREDPRRATLTGRRASPSTSRAASGPGSRRRRPAWDSTPSSPTSPTSGAGVGPSPLPFACDPAIRTSVRLFASIGSGLHIVSVAANSARRRDSTRPRPGSIVPTGCIPRPEGGLLVPSPQGWPASVERRQGQIPALSIRTTIGLEESVDEAVQSMADQPSRSRWSCIVATRLPSSPSLDIPRAAGGRGAQRDRARSCTCQVRLDRVSARAGEPGVTSRRL